MKKFIWLVILLKSICFLNSNFLFAENSFKDIPQIQIMFSPEDNCAKEIVKRIDTAENSVLVAMYFFTSRPMAKALLRAKQRGVDVKVCLDEDQPESKYSKVRFLVNNQVSTKLIPGAGYMHNKFCVIDGCVTITGSYNWTASADLKNDENVLFIESSEIADCYKKRFYDYWSNNYVDICEYKDKNSLEKIPLQTSAAIIFKHGLNKQKYIGDKNSKKFHKPNCSWAKKIKRENKVIFKTRKEALKKGYIPCKSCNP
ncbi:MAG: hypothetical protein DRP78_05420 [Candidatus Omnitrophota bacterium]|nr:MAG: hypothetical protein DRP78_05420 [Candidatus Omnitrophota bacterium]